MENSQVNFIQHAGETRKPRNSKWVLTGAFIAMLSGTSWASMQPMNPDEAAIVAVDRFSQKAGHLQVRTAGNHLPDANVPVDFDKGPFITQGLSPEGKAIRYYNFDVQNTTPASLYVLYREGEDHPVAGQLYIFDTLPGDMDYNDFRQVYKVYVKSDYVANTVTDAAAIHNAGYRMERTDTVYNLPVVPDKSVARERANGESASLQRGWYQGKVVKYFSFAESALTAGGAATVAVAPIYVTFNINPNLPMGGPASGFKTEMGSNQTHNVASAIPGDPAYSPLWAVSVYDNTDWPMVHNLDTVAKAKILAPAVATVNCPVVFVTP